MQAVFKWPGLLRTAHDTLTPVIHLSERVPRSPPLSSPSFPASLLSLGHPRRQWDANRAGSLAYFL